MEMEDRRGQFCVLLEGYKAEMKNMLNANPGFESRIQFALEFPDDSREELGEIATQYLTKSIMKSRIISYKRILYGYFSRCVGCFSIYKK